ncbi:MAG TPA: hypothetical protein VK176_08610 [Phycisphaerales bacterium]|nr:hypothetical protein [Phycisphaerales bacterium]
MKARLAARPLACVVAMCTSLLLPACAGQQKDPPEPVTNTGPLPAASDLVRVHNAGVEHLDRLWARTELRLRGVDKDGNTIDETAEGHFQFIALGNVSLTVNKVGETYFCLGANEIFYWWMDLRKPRNALLGRIDRATPKTVERFGVPVHPLDLIDLLGILPIELDEPANAPLAWSRDGTEAELQLAGRWGPRIFSFEVPSGSLRGVRLLDASGRIVCQSRIEKTERVSFRDDPSLIAQAPTRLVISIPASQMEITIVMHDPQNRGSAMKDAPFRPELLLKAYNIPGDMVRSLDPAPVTPTEPSSPASDQQPHTEPHTNAPQAD